MEAVVLPEAHIGHGAIFAVKSIVRKHVTPYAIISGNPSIVVKKRLDEKATKWLLTIA